MKFIFFTVLLALGVRAFAIDYIPYVDFNPDQITRVSAEIKKHQSEVKKIVLALGATPYERSHFKFDAANKFDAESFIVYFNAHPTWGSPDGTPTDDSGNNYICGDFNDLKCLGAMHEILTPCLDLIVTDGGVRKAMDLTKEQLICFSRLLVNDGSMVFPNHSYDSLVSESWKNEKEYLEEGVNARIKGRTERYQELFSKESQSQEEEEEKLNISNFFDADNNYIFYKMDIKQKARCLYINNTLDNDGNPKNNS